MINFQLLFDTYFFLSFSNKMGLKKFKYVRAKKKRFKKKTSPGNLKSFVNNEKMRWTKIFAHILIYSQKLVINILLIVHLLKFNISKSLSQLIRDMCVRPRHKMLKHTKVLEIPT